MDIVSNIKLDFARQTSPVIVYAKQWDYNSRRIVVEPLNRGIRFELPESVTARIQATKPDKTTVINDCNIEEGKIIVDLKEQILTVNGRVMAEIGLYKEDYCLSTQVFYIDVEKSAYDENALQSTNEFGYIEGALEKAETALSTSQTALDTSQTALNKATEALENLGGISVLQAEIVVDDSGFNRISYEPPSFMLDGQRRIVLLMADSSVVFDGRRWHGNYLGSFSWYDGTNWVDTTSLISKKFEVGQCILVEFKYSPENYSYEYQRILNIPS